MNGDAVEKLFIEYYNDALLYTLTLTKSRAVAEDIVAEAFYKALDSADGSVLSFKAWLLTVCRNICFNQHRRQKRLTVLDETLRDDREHAIEKILRDEEYHSLYHAIDLLPVEQKEVITLFYFEDMPISDIAAIISKSTTNTKVILFRARENLKKILEV